MYFEYGNAEIEYLKSKDKILGEAIDKIGMIKREVDTDLFSSVIHIIIGQQISTKAQGTIWKRFCEEFDEVTAERIINTPVDKLQSMGITFRKAEYIWDFAQKVHNGEFEIESLESISDDEVIKKLSSLKGIGVWTAEMLLIFCMQRSDIISYGDLAILRGMRMLYHHKSITPQLFQKYKRRYSPYASVASLYLWAIAAGVISELRDYEPLPRAKKNNG